MLIYCYSTQEMSFLLSILILSATSTTLKRNADDQSFEDSDDDSDLLLIEWMAAHPDDSYSSADTHPNRRYGVDYQVFTCGPPKERAIPT
ncbi:hypothetical protein V8B55DRAFT_1571204 [Mucor lusitanicus]